MNIEVKIKVNNDFYVNVETSEIIDSINEMPITQRWNYVAAIINEIEVSIDELNDEEKAIVKQYLEKKLELFSK